MKKNKNKYYTDFIIYKNRDLTKYIDDQVKFVSDNFKLLYSSMDKALDEVKSLSFYNSLNFDQQNSLLLWMNYFVFDYGLSDLLKKILSEDITFPIRKKGGSWIALGTCLEQEKRDINLLMHRYSGQRTAYYKNIANYNEVHLSVYGTEGFPSIQYDRSPDYTFFEENINLEEELAKLLFIVNEGIDPESIGFNVEYLKAIPWLLKCKVLKKENNKLTVNIPVLSSKEMKDIYNITLHARQSFVEDNIDLVTDFIKDKKQTIPPHLNNIFVVKQYYCATNALVMALIRKAINDNKIYNGHYDEEKNSIPSAMVLVIDK